MKLKSFFAGSVEEALSDARREFGPEAVLVQSRRASAEARHLGDYEVVCALLPEDEQTASAAPARAERATRDHPGNNDVQRLAGELGELKRCMQRLQTSVVLAGAAAVAPGTPPQVREVLSLLMSAEVDGELAQQIVGDAGTHATGQAADGDFIPGNGARLATLVHRHVMRLAATRGLPGEDLSSGTRAVALVGPPGAGKTTCIAKLAARYAITMHRRAHVLSMDEFRVGGSEQLRAFASILGVGFDTLTHDASLASAIDERREDLILVDVPGFSGSEMDLAAQVARKLRAQQVEVHLVLPVSMRTADMRRVAESFAIFEPAALIFTRLDETETYGPLLNEIVRSGKPASFLSNGPRVPEDIEPATRARIADLVLSKAPGTTRMSWAAA